MHLALRRQQNSATAKSAPAPHCLYSRRPPPQGLAPPKQRQARSFPTKFRGNLEAPPQLADEIRKPPVIIKTQSCGTAEQAKSGVTPTEKAAASDPYFRLGARSSLQRPVGRRTRRRSAKLFPECIAAPALEEKSKSIFAPRKNLRLLERLPASRTRPRASPSGILGGMLVQQPDLGESTRRTCAPHKRVPTQEEMHNMRRRLEGLQARYNPTPSSSLAMALTLGVGAGQMVEYSVKNRRNESAIAVATVRSSPPTRSCTFPMA